MVMRIPLPGWCFSSYADARSNKKLTNGWHLIAISNPFSRFRSREEPIWARKSSGSMICECGDRLLLRNGELIPADATLVEGSALIDYSFVTGEA